MMQREPLSLVTCLGFCYLAKMPVVPGSASTVLSGVERPVQYAYPHMFRCEVVFTLTGASNFLENPILWRCRNYFEFTG